MTNWIDVNDKMPGDEHTKVLIAFDEPFFGGYTKEWEAGYYDNESGKWRFWMSDREVLGPGVTHWAEITPPTKRAEG